MLEDNGALPFRGFLRAGEPAGDEAGVSESVRAVTPFGPSIPIPQELVSLLRDVSPDGNAEPDRRAPDARAFTIPLTSSIPFWRGRWASRSSSAQDLVVKDGRVFMKTTKGLKRVDVIYRRLDDDFLDPAGFPARIPSSAFRDWSTRTGAGNVNLANAIGTGVADDKVDLLFCARR